MTSDFSRRRRFLLGGILPVSLLLIAIPLAPHFTPQVQQAFNDASVRQGMLESSTAPLIYPSADEEGAPRISPSIEKDLQRSRRVVALDVLKRLEEETRQQGGTTRLTPLDLKRLRNALH